MIIELLVKFFIICFTSNKFTGSTVDGKKQSVCGML